MAYAGKSTYSIGVVGISPTLSAALIQKRIREAQLLTSLDGLTRRDYPQKSTVTQANLTYFLEQNGVYGRVGKIAMINQKIANPDSDFPETDYSVARESAVIPLAEQKRASQNAPATFTLNLEGLVRDSAKRQGGQRQKFKDLYVRYGHDAYGRDRYLVITKEAREAASEYFTKIKMELDRKNRGLPQSQSVQREIYEQRILDLGENVAFVLENKTTGVTYEVVMPKKYHIVHSAKGRTAESHFDLAA